MEKDLSAVAIETGKLARMPSTALTLSPPNSHRKSTLTLSSQAIFAYF